MIVVVATLAALAVLAWPSRGSAGLARAVLGPSRGAPTPVPAVEIASVMELLALVLRSGVGVVEALEMVGNRCDDVCGVHLRTVAAALRWGVDEATAWEGVPSAWAPLAGALTLAARAGVAPAGLLERRADDVRRAELHRLEEEAARLGVRVVLPLGLAFLPAFVLTTVVPTVIALTGDILAG